MIETYIEWIFIILIAYITIFNILTGHLQQRWSMEFKRKLQKIYFSIWILPYTFYLYCVWATPTTKPLFIYHILLGAIFHLVFSIFGYKATML